MRLSITSTDQIGEVNGAKGRVWIGETESGIPVQVFIASIAVRSDAGHDLTQFERELIEHVPASTLRFPLESQR